MKEERNCKINCQFVKDFHSSQLLREFISTEPSCQFVVPPLSLRSPRSVSPPPPNIVGVITSRIKSK
ncbi:unnamed protein product [Hermetia illucens]|uniref:Uncharacterized protein n=1 Tax=Hermetia illucens TaxID=343691 RepID=A0A7R8UA23_HERIL|nr:unnamed protein product [Hermetia illucens]